MTFYSKAALLMTGLFVFAGPASADIALEACVSEHNGCTQICFDNETDGATAACIAKCAAIEAQCVGEVGLKTGEPFIREKVEELEGFMKRFFDDVLPIPKETPAPKPPPTNATDT